MIRRWSLIALMLGCVMAALPVGAAGDYWTAWLYDWEFGRVVLIDSDGMTLKDQVLPAVGGNQYSHQIAVSRDGRLIAYTTTLYDPASATATATLVVYNTDTNTTVFTVALPPNGYYGLDYGGSMYMFSPTNNRLAFGYAAFAGDTAIWQVMVADLASSTIVNTLDSSSAIAVASGAADVNALVAPVVQNFTDSTIAFTLVAAASEGSPIYPAFAWNFSAGTVTPNDVYTSMDMDQNALGEAVITTHDPDYPYAYAGESGFPIPNLFNAYDITSGSVLPFYEAPGAFDPVFVQSSELIAYRSFNPVTFADEALRVIRRDGVTVGELTSAVLPLDNITSVDGTVNGFIYTASGGTGRAGGTTVYRVFTRPGSIPDPMMPVSIWNSTLGANYVIAWISDEQYGPTEMPTAWGTLSAGMLIEPPLPPTSAPAVSTPSVLPMLRIGGSALVQTTEGDPLNVRSGPGTSNAIVTRVASGTVVTLLAGPINANGYNWWQVQLPGGTMGWCVESADGIQTLIPR